AAKENSVPDTVKAVREGKANAGVVYLSAAVAAQNDLEIVRFPASVNMSEAIRNAASVPGTAKNPKEATDFVRFLLTAEAQKILTETGQPPVVPALRKGSVPASITN
ncbi:MAG: Bacterial extracellular solute-binding protein, partial [Alphaproteobacteria bacterium]|nr:Bacterial extracellular solute-binding protein [Alphaproteobacteria bacterium]